MSFRPLSAFLNLLKARCNNFYIKNPNFLSNHYKFIVDEHFVGLVRPYVVEEFLRTSDVFIKHRIDNENLLLINPKFQTFDERSNAVAKAMDELRMTSKLKAFEGWRNEDFGIYTKNRCKALFKMERSASILLGITRYGVHVNGYTYIINPTSQKREMFMWIAKRSMTKKNNPGMLDNIVGGGLTYDMTISNCVIKECMEEASIPIELMENLKPVSTVSCMSENEKGISPNVEFCFDLELPLEFVPINSDGEVDDFILYSIGDVKELICSDIFKPNSGLVIVDFLLRHGFITPDEDTADYMELCSLLRRDFPFH